MVLHEMRTEKERDEETLKRWSKIERERLSRGKKNEEGIYESVFTSSIWKERGTSFNSKPFPC